jgi:RNA polymerase sigma-70 factor (ECF subfamily)
LAKSSREIEEGAESLALPEAASLRRPDELLGLARAAANRDSVAASTLVLQVAGSMLGTVRQVLGSGHPDIEDVAQEAVIAFLGSLEQFRGECSTQSYAQRVALFTALAARRRLVARRRLIDADQSAEVLAAPSRSSPLAETVAAQRREVVAKVLDSLPDVIAEALALHFILGYTVDEIAVACCAPPNTVWSRLRLGKQALRRTLQRNAKLGELFGGEE